MPVCGEMPFTLLASTTPAPIPSATDRNHQAGQHKGRNLTNAHADQRQTRQHADDTAAGFFDVLIQHQFLLAYQRSATRDEDARENPRGSNIEVVKDQSKYNRRRYYKNPRQCTSHRSINTPSVSA